MSDTSVKLPDEAMGRLEELARMTGRTTSFLAGQFVEDFPDRGPCQVAEIAQAIDEANAGDFASENDVVALREKLGAYAR